jgi:hypothetical protein
MGFFSFLKYTFLIFPAQLAHLLRRTVWESQVYGVHVNKRGAGSRTS